MIVLATPKPKSEWKWTSMGFDHPLFHLPREVARGLGIEYAERIDEGEGIHVSFRGHPIHQGEQEVHFGPCSIDGEEDGIKSTLLGRGRRLDR